jgi:hypothetical protein
MTDFAVGLISYPVFVYKSQEMPSGSEAEFVNDNNLFKKDNWQKHMVQGTLHIDRSWFLVYTIRGQSVKVHFRDLYNFQGKM